MGLADESAWGEPYVAPPPLEPHSYRDPTSAARWTCLMLGIWAVIELIALYSNFMALFTFRELAAGSPTVTMESFADIDLRDSVLTVGSLLAYFATAVFFLRWTFLAAGNAHALTSKRMEFTQQSAVWWYFIPFANLYKPYKAMAEIWNVTTGLNSSLEHDPGMPARVRVWWMLMFFSAGTSWWEALALRDFKDVSQANGLYQIKLIAGTISLVWGLTAYLMVKGLTELQVQRNPSMETSMPDTVGQEPAR